MSIWPQAESRSRQLYTRSDRVLAGGVARITPWQTPFPIYAACGEGAYVIDVDGTRRLDLGNNLASLVHGHAHPAVVKAVQEQVARGSAFALPTETEVSLAEELCRRVNGFERVRFSNSGSEAIMSAIKAARALTGRSKIVKVEGSYHGMYDYAEVSLDSSPQNWGSEPRSVAYAAGTPRSVTEDVIVIPFNEPEVAERIILSHRDQIAGILVDANPSYLGFAQISKPFANALQESARSIGALVILDEVMSFRVHVGGAQTLFGLKPDLTALGKIIGGGFPVGGVAGSEKVMSVFDHRRGKPGVPWSGTFTANPVTMTAGRITLELLQQREVDHITALGDDVRRRVTQLFHASGFPGQITGVSSMFRLHGHRREVTSYRSAYAQPGEIKVVESLQRELIDEGFLVTRGFGFISTVTTQADIDGFIDAMTRCVTRLMNQGVA
jgi:glutamate-1-semialdehyde 2,1-aminomutase